MEIEDSFKKLRKFLDNLTLKGIELSLFKKESNLAKYLEKCHIKVGLEQFKEVILQEETGLELGGINKKSFSLIYPILNINNRNCILNGKITLIGPEIKDISESAIDFGIIIFITGEKFTDRDLNLLREFNFISNGIEGFLIRSIPRKFWCRVSKDVIEKKFSFQFLANAIFYLYEQKFENLIDSMEIIFINSYPKLIDESVEITSTLRTQINKRWIEKIDEWRKRINCEYDWGCEICPYQEECYDIKQVLVEREKIKK